jgi:hypothetical protein
VTYGNGASRRADVERYIQRHVRGLRPEAAE